MSSHDREYDVPIRLNVKPPIKWREICIQRIWCIPLFMHEFIVYKFLAHPVGHTLPLILKGFIDSFN